MTELFDDDFALLDRWIAGDSASGNQLFTRHFPSVYRFFAHKAEGDADDLVQDTFMACLRGRETFKRQSTFRTYLFAIARHVLLGYWRKRAPSGSILPIEDVSIASLSTSLGTRLGNREDRARLLAVLRELPIDQQILLEMYYWQDLDRERLAEIFDVEVATIGSRLFRARKELLEQLSMQASNLDAIDAWVRSCSDG